MHASEFYAMPQRENLYELGAICARVLIVSRGWPTSTCAAPPTFDSQLNLCPLQLFGYDVPKLPAIRSFTVPCPQMLSRTPMFYRLVSSLGPRKLSIW